MTRKMFRLLLPPVNREVNHGSREVLKQILFSRDLHQDMNVDEAAIKYDFCEP